MREMDDLYVDLRNTHAEYERHRAQFATFCGALRGELSERVKELGVTNVRCTSTRIDFDYLGRAFGVRFMAPPLAERVPLEFFRVEVAAGAGFAEQASVLGTVHMDRLGNLYDAPDANHARRAVGAGMGPLEQLMLWLKVAAGVQ